MIPVGQLAPGDQWDQNLLDRLFDNTLYPTGLEFKRVEGYPNTDGAVLVVPGRYWWGSIDRINEAIARYDWLLLMRVGDEEDQFDIAKVSHPNARFWVQTPRTDREYDARLFGVGFPPHFNALPAGPPEKLLDVFLSAQNTHERRNAAFDVLKPGERWTINETQHFTHGFTAGDYASLMAAAKVGPAPAGPESPDTFRLYEALEAHCVPIADDVTPRYPSAGYWERIFPGCPFPVYTDAANLLGYCQDALNGWPANANRIAAYWMRYKRRLAHWLKDDLEALGAL
jgi:hypothetical protein